MRGLIQEQVADQYASYTMRRDKDYPVWHANLSPEGREARHCLMYHLSELAASLPGEDAITPAGPFPQYVMAQLKRCMGGLPDIGFEFYPDVPYWLKLAADEPRNRELHRRTLKRISEILGLRYDEPVDIYGNLKDTESVNRKVQQHYESGEPLDLWDRTRLRIVPQTLNGVALISGILLCECRPQIIRLRNYYTHPRSPDSLYRGIHFIFAAEGGYIEVQVMTLARELVCQFDHAVIFKKTLQPMDDQHIPWLRRMSLAANVYELTNGFNPGF